MFIDVFEEILDAITGTGVIEYKESGDRAYADPINLRLDTKKGLLHIVMDFECKFEPNRTETARIHAFALDYLIPKFKFFNITVIEISFYNDTEIDIKVCAKVKLDTKS